MARYYPANSYRVIAKHVYTAVDAGALRLIRGRGATHATFELEAYHLAMNSSSVMKPVHTSTCKNAGINDHMLVIISELL